MTAPENQAHQSEEWEEIWLLFAQEGKETLNIIEDALLKIETDAGNLERISKLFRAMHTFKGMARMMGLSVTETLSHCAEDLLGLVRDKNVALTSEMIDLLLAIFDQLRYMLKHAVKHRDDCPAEQVETLAARARTMATQLSETALPKEEIPPPPPPPVTQKASPEPLPDNFNLPDVDLFAAIPEEDLALINAVDPATDPVFVAIFLELVEGELNRLHTALNDLGNGDETALVQVQDVTTSLEYATRQMGHETLLILLKNITVAVEHLNGEAQLTQLKQEEIALWKELATLQQTTQPADQPCPEQFVHTRPAQPVSPKIDQIGSRQSAIQTESLTNFIDDVGELVAAHTIIRHTAEKLSNTDLIDTVTRLIRLAAVDEKYIRKDIQQSLQTWVEDLGVLKQKISEMSSTLGQLHETALALRLRPAARILDVLPHLVEETAQHHDKVIKLELTGAETELDQSILDLLDNPVRQLVRFSAAYSIEELTQRATAGKTTPGHILVKAGVVAGHSRIEIKDNGRGINLDTVRHRLDELGWTYNEDDPSEKLLEWTFKEGFGPIGNGVQTEGVDFSALQQQLQPRQGRLTVENKSGLGMRFIIDVPLNMGVLDSMVACVDNIHYVIPVKSIHRIVKPEETDIIHASANGHQAMLRLNEALVPIRRLSGDRGIGLLHHCIMLVVEQDEDMLALCVDKLLGQQQVFFRPLQSYLTQIQGVSGCVLLGDGEVGMVLDLRRLTA